MAVGNWAGRPTLLPHFCQNSPCPIHLIRWRILKKLESGIFFISLCVPWADNCLSDFYDKQICHICQILSELRVNFLFTFVGMRYLLMYTHSCISRLSYTTLTCKVPNCDESLTKLGEIRVSQKSDWDKYLTIKLVFLSLLLSWKASSRFSR